MLLNVGHIFFFYMRMNIFAIIEHVLVWLPCWLCVCGALFAILCWIYLIFVIFFLALVPPFGARNLFDIGQKIDSLPNKFYGKSINYNKVVFINYTFNVQPLIHQYHHTNFEIHISTIKYIKIHKIIHTIHKINGDCYMFSLYNVSIKYI